MNHSLKRGIGLIVAAHLLVVCIPLHAQDTTGSGDSTSETSGEEETPRQSYSISIHDPQSQTPGGALSPRLRELLNRPHHELYQGIIPGWRDDLAGDVGSDGVETNEVTWIGMTPERDRTRVFIQTRHPIQHRTRPGDTSDETIIVLEDTRITKSNFSRFIDASHFGREVQRIEARQTDSDTVEVSIRVAEGAEADISGENRYLYFDVPHHPEEGTQRAVTAGQRGPEDPTAPPDRVEPDDEEPESTDPAAVDDKDAPEPDEDPSPSPAQRIVDDDDEEDGTASVASPRRRIGLISGLSGLGLAAGAGALAWMADSRRSQVTDVPRGEVVPMTQQQGAELEQTTNRLDTAALIMAIAGSAAFVTGGILWLSAPSLDATSQHSLGPRLDTREGTVGFDWTFRF